MPNGTKYALALLPNVGRRGEHNDAQQLTPDMTTWVGSLSDVIEPSELEHWKEWLGSLQWEQHTRGRRMVLVTMPSERPEVIDHENDQLRNRIARAWYGLLLAAPLHPVQGEARCVTGEVQSLDPAPRLHSIRDEGGFGKASRPLYASSEGFTSNSPWRTPDLWFDRWVYWTSIVDQAFAVGLPDIIDVALFAFRMALGRGRLEFSIPEFIRTAECILAVPAQNGGRKVFAQRALQIAPDLGQHWYIDTKTLRERFQALYQHRSDCVHGKVPFAVLRQQGKEGVEEASRLEFLAEALAREALRHALSDPTKFPLFDDRNTLEDAWANRQYP
ncbi:MAG: hypothetical protein ACHQ53_13425 [Polyangiales bacterium]